MKEIFSALFGTTSAYAENTWTNKTSWTTCGNYLRVRGEYLRYLCFSTFLGELPPRTRRIRFTIYLNGIWRGTTSAYAENTPNELGIL